MSASIRIDGMTAALQGFGGLKDRLVNSHVMWDRIGAALETSTQERFNRGGPVGAPWPVSAAARKRSGQTLVGPPPAGGRLRDSFAHQATATGVAVGTNVLYAAIHQFGGTIARGARKQVLSRFVYARGGKLKKGFVKASKANFQQRVDVGAYSQTLPARPFLMVDAQDETEILTIASEHYAGGLA